MEPLLSGKIPEGQRFTVDGIAVAFGSQLTFKNDLAALDKALITMNVQDNFAEKQKIRGHVRNFPAGGGGYITADRTHISSDLDFDFLNNGLPTPEAIYAFAPTPRLDEDPESETFGEVIMVDTHIILDPSVAFSVVIDIPVALSGLTTSRWYVYLHGQYEFFLDQ